MQNLDEWNKKAKKEWLERRKRGVLCPNCGREMVQSPLLFSVGEWTCEEKPPTQDVYCPACNYKGEMILRKEIIEKIELPEVKLEPGEITIEKIPLLETAIKKINEIIDKRY